MRIFVHPLTKPAEAIADQVRNILSANGFTVVRDELWRGHEPIIYVTKTDWQRRQLVTIGMSRQKIPIIPAIAALKRAGRGDSAA